MTVKDKSTKNGEGFKIFLKSGGGEIFSGAILYPPAEMVDNINNKIKLFFFLLFTFIAISNLKCSSVEGDVGDPFHSAVV